MPRHHRGNLESRHCGTEDRPFVRWFAPRIRIDIHREGAAPEQLSVANTCRRIDLQADGTLTCHQLIGWHAKPLRRSAYERLPGSGRGLGEVAVVEVRGMRLCPG